MSAGAGWDTPDETEDYEPLLAYAWWMCGGVRSAFERIDGGGWAAMCPACAGEVLARRVWVNDDNWAATVAGRATCADCDRVFAIGNGMGEVLCND